MRRTGRKQPSSQDEKDGWTKEAHVGRFAHFRPEAFQDYVPDVKFIGLKKIYRRFLPSSANDGMRGNREK